MCSLVSKYYANQAPPSFYLDPTASLYSLRQWATRIHEDIQRHDVLAAIAVANLTDKGLGLVEKWVGVANMAAYSPQTALAYVRACGLSG